MKRTLFIVASIIFLIGVGVGIYLLFFNSQPKLSVGSADDFANTTSDNQRASSNGTSAAITAVVIAPNLVEITNKPVAAGTIAFDLPDHPVLASSTSPSTLVVTSYTPGDIQVQYVDRESGNIYAYQVQARTLARISNKTLPGIQLASWLPDGSIAFVQFLSKIDGIEHVGTYALSSSGNSSYSLQQDLDQTLVIGSSTVFTLNVTTAGSVGTIAHADGTSAKALFSTPLTSLVIHSTTKGFTASTRAAAEIDGYAFFISGNTFSPILGPLHGLTVLPNHAGTSLLYSYADGNTFHLSVLNLVDGSTTELPLATLTEKCVWANDDSSVYCGVPTSLAGNQPDDWYQGTVSFTDKIWNLDLSTRLATLILDPTQTGKTSIDAVNLTLDPSSRVLVFRNKKNGSLWAYNL
jgi:hypothetical protein